MKISKIVVSLICCLVLNQNIGESTILEVVGLLPAIPLTIGTGGLIGLKALYAARLLKLLGLRSENSTVSQVLGTNDTSFTLSNGTHKQEVFFTNDTSTFGRFWNFIGFNPQQATTEKPEVPSGPIENGQTHFGKPRVGQAKFTQDLNSSTAIPSTAATTTVIPTTVAATILTTVATQKATTLLNDRKKRSNEITINITSLNANSNSSTQYPYPYPLPSDDSNVASRKRIIIISGNSSNVTERNDTSSNITRTITPGVVYADETERRSKRSITKEIVPKYFDFIKTLDSSNCLSQMICEIGQLPSKYGKYGENLANFFNKLNQSEYRNDSVIHYYNSYNLGKSDGQLCNATYTGCTQNMTSLVSSLHYF